MVSQSNLSVKFMLIWTSAPSFLFSSRSDKWHIAAVNSPFYSFVRQIMDRCRSQGHVGLNHVPEMIRSFQSNLIAESWLLPAMTAHLSRVSWVSLEWPWSPDGFEHLYYRYTLLCPALLSLEQDRRILSEQGYFLFLKLLTQASE